VSAGKKRAKISVGSNPWATVPRTHNIAAICESYGGGGHPAVGAVSFPPDRVEDARRVAAEICEKLKT
jgi:nanoRNase/pAp phosphatase (c-di-AMP/oligoRNAs hydrolase)